jgi:hypothetical protein
MIFLFWTRSRIQCDTTLQLSAFCMALLYVSR